MTDNRQAMVETLETRTFLSGGGHFYAHAAAVHMEAAAIQMALAAMGAREEIVMIAIDLPGYKIELPHFGFGGGVIRHEVGFPRIAPPMPMPAYPQPVKDAPPVEQPAPPVTEPAPPAKDQTSAPVASPEVTSHQTPDQQPHSAVTGLVTHAVKPTAVQVNGGETATVEVLDASGSHPVVSSVTAAPRTEMSSIFSGLFSRSIAEGGTVVAKALQVASAAPAVMANAVPAAARALESALPTPERVFHIERLSNPLALIGDAAAAFAEESALLGSAIDTGRYMKAWAITGAVVAFDAAVLMYWVHARRRRRTTSAQMWFLPLVD